VGCEVLVGDWFVAVGAGPAGPDAAGEQVAVGAAALGEVAGVAGRAFVDDDGGGWGGGCGVALPPGLLLAGVAAEAAAA